MYVKAIAFFCLALSYEVSCLPFLNYYGSQDPGYYRSYRSYSAPLSRQFQTISNGPATYQQTSIDPATGQEVVTHYITHSRPGGPITALVQNSLNTVGRLVGELGSALGNALGGTLTGAGQFGQDIQDFLKPITINQIVRPHPGPAPVRPVPTNPPPRPPSVLLPDPEAD